MPCLCYLSIVSFYLMYISLWEKAGFMHRITGIKARMDLFLACFFCAKKSAAGYAGSSHNGKKEGSNAEKN